MRKCNIYLMNRLINQEFPRAYRKIVSRLVNSDFEVEDVQQSFDTLSARVADLDFVKSNLTLHELSEPIAELRNIRHQHLLSLKGRVKYSLKSPFEAERTAAKTLNIWLKRERDYLTFKNIERQSQSVYRMNHDMSLSVKLGEALTVLGLENMVTSLQEISTEIDMHYKTLEDDQKATKQKNVELRDNGTLI